MDVRQDEQAWRRRSGAGRCSRWGIDVLVNDASAISLTDTAHTPMEGGSDLIHQVNVRGRFSAQSCQPHLARSPNPHILTLCPPPDAGALVHAAPRLIRCPNTE